MGKYLDKDYKVMVYCLIDEQRKVSNKFNSAGSVLGSNLRLSDCSSATRFFIGDNMSSGIYPHKKTQGFQKGHNINLGKHRSEKTKEKLRVANWQGGKIMSTHGYSLIRVPEGHHLRMSDGYAYEHRLVAEEKIGRRLLPDEIVHHINGIKTDNRKENIQICPSQFSHRVNHRISGKYLRLPNQENLLIICSCGCGSQFEQFDKEGRPRKCLNGHQYNILNKGQ